MIICVYEPVSYNEIRKFRFIEILNEGVENISVRKVADLAGYSYTTIYDYFTDINELLQEVKTVMIRERLCEIKYNKQVQITTADNGNDIPIEFSESIFSSFVMGDTSRNSRDGSRLGLVISKKIIERHRGSIQSSRDIPNYTKAFIIYLSSNSYLGYSLGNIPMFFKSLRKIFLSNHA